MTLHYCSNYQLYLQLKLAIPHGFIVPPYRSVEHQTKQSPPATATNLESMKSTLYTRRPCRLTITNLANVNISYHCQLTLCVNKICIITRRPASAVRTACRQFQATGQPVSQMQASDAIDVTAAALWGEVCATQVAGASNAGRSLCVQISRERSFSLPIYWYHSEGNWLRYNCAAESLYIMKLCSRLFVFYCRNCQKDEKFRYLIPILRKIGAT